MPRMTIDELRANTFITTYQWNIKFRLPAALKSIASSDDLNVRCVTTDIPKASVENIETSIRGHKTGQPGPLTYSETINIVFAETIDAKIQRFLAKWRQLCTADKTGKHGKRKDYEIVIEMEQLDVEDLPMYSYHLQGCRYEDSERPAMNNEAGGFQPSVSVRYDYHTEESI